MKCRIPFNKKGLSIDEAIPFVIFILIAVFGVFLYNINENVKGKQLTTDIQMQKDILNGHGILMDYLKQSDEQGNNKADFIAKHIIEKDYDNIKKDLTEYFSKNIGNINWYIEVKDSSNNLIFPQLTNSQYSSHEQYSSTQITYSVAFASIPVYGQESSYISIELFFSNK